MIAAADQVVEAVQDMLAGFEGIEGAFVYGSVARGTAGQGSDIDLFVVTVADLAPDVRARFGDAADRLQRELGYRPDPAHLVEVFSTATCARAVTGPLVLRATHQAADGSDIDRITLDSDDLEILRALLDQQLIVRHSPVVDGLTMLARRQVTAAAHRLDVADHHVLAGIGLTHPAAPTAAVSTPEDTP